MLILKMHTGIAIMFLIFILFYCELYNCDQKYQTANVLFQIVKGLRSGHWPTNSYLN